MTRKLLRRFKLNGTYVRINIRDMQRMVVQKA